MKEAKKERKHHDAPERHHLLKHLRKRQHRTSVPFSVLANQAKPNRMAVFVLLMEYIIINIYGPENT